jgi:hypothetical protein
VLKAEMMGVLVGSIWGVSNQHEFEGLETATEMVLWWEEHYGCADELLVAASKVYVRTPDARKQWHLEGACVIQEIACDGR